MLLFKDNAHLLTQFMAACKLSYEPISQVQIFINFFLIEWFMPIVPIANKFRENIRLVIYIIILC